MGLKGDLSHYLLFIFFFSFFEAKASHINCCLLVYNVCQYVVNKYEHSKNTLVTNYGSLWFFFQRSFNSNIYVCYGPLHSTYFIDRVLFIRRKLLICSEKKYLCKIKVGTLI